MLSHPHLKSFTLLELLIVIGILAVLATVLIAVIRPAEMLKQSRDATRLAQFDSLRSALNIAMMDEVNLGSLNTVYISLPSNNPQCSDLSLPPLPDPWVYHCSNSTNYRNIDGTGWIPINFKSLSVGSPLSALPQDPINNTTYYYTYTTGGSYELTALLESTEKHKAMEEDGGINPFVLELGTDLSLLPIDPSLSVTRDPRFEISVIPNNTDQGTFGYWTFGTWSGYNHEINTTQRPDGSTGKVLKITKTSAVGGEDMFDYMWRDKTSLGQKYKWCMYAKGDGGAVKLNSHWGTLGIFTPTADWQRYCIEFIRSGTINQYNFFKFDNINTWVELWFVQVVPTN